MSERVFVDTNVLIYARDAGETLKQPRATEWLAQLWRHHLGRVSFQVLNEYYVIVTQKLSPGLPLADARADVRDLLSWHPMAIDQLMLEDAWSLEERFALSHWDALVVAAARVAGCKYLLTEDLQAGQDFDGLIVVDPFSTAPEELLRT